MLTSAPSLTATSWPLFTRTWASIRMPSSATRSIARSLSCRGTRSRCASCVAKGGLHSPAHLVGAQQHGLPVEEERRCHALLQRPPERSPGTARLQQKIIRLIVVEDARQPRPPVRAQLGNEVAVLQERRRKIKAAR